MKNLIIIDICHTLVKTNTTYSYMKYLMKNWVKPCFNYLFFNKFTTLIIIIFKSLFNIDIEEKIIALYFKWINLEKLEKINNNYFNRYEKQISLKIFKIIEDNRINNKIILLSAAVNPPIDFLKKKLNLEWYSSKLVEKKWIYNWKFQISLRWKKELIFQKWIFKINWYESIRLYTDNKDDINLMLYLKNQCTNFKSMIIPYKNKDYWEKILPKNDINYEFIY